MTSAQIGAAKARTAASAWPSSPWRVSGPASDATRVGVTVTSSVSSENDLRRPGRALPIELRELVLNLLEVTRTIVLGLVSLDFVFVERPKGAP